MLKYQPKPGSIVQCDFKGYIVPEIVKKRPVLVIHMHPHHHALVAVVPFSTSQPENIHSYHFKIDSAIEQGIDEYISLDNSWIKCDLVYVVSIERLDMFIHKVRKKRGFPKVSQETLQKVKVMMREAIGV